MSAGLFDHHVHSDRSDGRRTLAERASSVSLRPHGVSDHYPYRERMRTDDDVRRYVDDARRLGLRVGLEYDLGAAPPLLAATRDALDYLIGAVHQVWVDGERFGFDHAGAYLKGRGRQPFAEVGKYADAALRTRVLDRILEAVREGVEDVGIDILGHPTMSPLVALGDPETGLPGEFQDRLVALCVDAGVAIELNEAYGLPHAAFVARAKRAGARFSVGSDSHGELLPLEWTERAIAEAALPVERFLAGRSLRRA
ncbi:MAG TPA: PHP domain-containing protein [Candidatus Limnocylindrales bacterium]|nr:PHP domain-containing protein [Candidatus Limnocylindrales bacterium]